MVLKKILLEYGLNGVFYEDDNSQVKQDTTLYSPISILDDKMLYYYISTLEDTSDLPIRTVDDIQYLPIGTLADIRAKGKGTKGE